jgi:hypothetical protein
VPKGSCRHHHLNPSTTGFMRSLSVPGGTCDRKRASKWNYRTHFLISHLHLRFQFATHVRNDYCIRPEVRTSTSPLFYGSSVKVQAEMSLGVSPCDGPLTAAGGILRCIYATMDLGIVGWVMGPNLTQNFGR